MSVEDYLNELNDEKAVSNSETAFSSILV